MKKNFSILALTFLLFLGGNGFAVTYIGTLSTSSVQFSASPQSITLSTISWTLTNNGGFYGVDATKGQQIGSAGSPATSMTFATSGIAGTITDVKITTSGASSVVATVGVTVGGSAFGGSAQSISATSTQYTFSGSASGTISINWTQTSSKALYIKEVQVIYTTATDYFWNGGNSTNNTNNIWDLNTTRNWGITTGATFAANTAPGVVWPTSGSYNANFSNTVAGAKTVSMPAAISVMPNSTVIGTTGYSFVPSATQTFSSPVTLTNLLTVAPTTGTSFTMSGVLSGAGGITQDGAGTTILSGNSTHTGTTTVTSGTLRLGAAGSGANTPLGTTAAGTTVSSGGVLDLNGFTLATAEGLNLNGTGISSGGALINSSGTAATYSGAVTLASNSSIGTTGNITLSGVVSGAGISLTKVGAGSLILSGNNTYSGTTTISSGTLAISAAERITNSSNIILNGGTFSTGVSTGFTETVGTLSLQNNSTIALGTGNHTLTFAASNAVSWASSTVLTITGWTGTINCGAGTAGKIFVGSASTALTAAQLAQIKFTISGVDYPATLLSTGELVPTLKLVVTNPGTQYDGVPFNVTVTATDFNGTARTLTATTGITLSSSTHTIGGTITGSITSGNSAGTINSVTLTPAGPNATITATASSGLTCLLSGTSSVFDVLTPSTPTLSAGALTGFGSSVCVGTTAGPNSFTLSGAALDGTDVSVSGNAVYTFATTAGGTYSNPLTLTAYNGTSPSSIFVKFTPSSAANFDGNITISGGGAASVTTAVTGTGINGTPAVTTVTATSITATSASSGGNTISTTCGTITDKGVVWSLSANPTIVSNLGITSDGTGTTNYTSSIGSLSPNTLYNYRAYVTNSNGITTYGSNLTFTTLKAEPSNYPTSFACGTTTTTTIPLTWTDASTGALPDGYLIKWSSVSYAAILDPVDGTAVANGAGVQNVAQGTGNYTVTSLTAGTTYYFKIWSYSNSGTNINYKLTSEPQTSCNTISASSDITNDLTYSLTSNFDYKLWQSSSQTSASDGLGMFNIIIRDGGSSSPDVDNKPTILNAISFSCPTFANIRSAALFTTTGALVQSVAVSTSTITFSSLSGIGANVTAPDNGTIELILRLSFNNTPATITDNTKIVFTVSSATAASTATSSQFGTFSLTSDNDGDNENRLEVTASKLNISTITDGFVGVDISAFTITAADVNNITDLDRTENVALTTSGTGMTSSTPYALVAGVVSISNVQYGSAQSGINITGTVSSPSLTGTSNNFNITAATFVTGDYRTNPAVLPGDYVAFGSAAIGSISGVRVWQYWSGSAWVDATTPPQSVTTVPPNIYINRGSTVDVAGGRLYNNIYVDLEDDTYIFGSYSSTPGLSIATGKVLEIKKGTFQLGGILDLQGTSSLIIRKKATMEIQNTVTSTEFTRNASTTWEVEDTAFVFIDAYVPNAWTGTEIFHDESYFDITDWSNANPLFTGTGSSIISPTTVSGYSALFGNLSITIPTTGLAGNWTGMLPASVSFNLTHGDFDVINNETDNISLYSGNTSTIRIGRNMSVGGTGNFQMQTGAGTLNFTIDSNFVKNGTGEFRIHTFGSASPGNDVIFNIDGNLTVNNGFFISSTASASGTSETINLKGNLKKFLAGYMTQANSSGFANSSFNFTGTSTQTVDAVLQNSNDVLRYRFFVKSGATVQIINQDWRFADQSRLTVEDGGTLDFGFNGTTALNLTETVSSATTLFALNQRGTLKITSPLGITTTAGAFGNVQLDSRTYDQVATFWYIGKANQVTGNGITTASSAKVIICDLIDNTTTLTPSNQTGVSSTATVDAFYGGHLYIKKGQFRETTSAYITSSTGTLRMDQGTLYYIPKGSANATLSNGDYIPRMSGGTYYLTGGTIEFAGTGTGVDAFQTLRGSRNYNKLKFSGANTYLTDYKNLSSNAAVDSSVEITNGAVVDCIDGSLNGKSFTGNGGLLMSGASSRFRIKKTGSTAQPELDGVNIPYNLSNGTVEFYGTLATEQQQLRGNYTVCTSCTKPKINYYNIDVNATAANLQTFSSTPTSGNLGSVGNVDINESFLLTGTLNVNSPAVLRMDQSDFVDDGSAAGVVNINSGAGLLYANVDGISNLPLTSGNIRTSGTRTFSSGANYGFVSGGDMSSGNGLPNTVAGLYIYKSFWKNTVTLNNSGTLVKGVLGLQKGKILSSTSSKLVLDSIRTSSIASPSNVGTVSNMGYDSSYIVGPTGHNSQSTSIMTFPIGSTAKYGPLALTPFNNTAQTYTCDYTSTGYGTYTLDPLNSPQLDHVSLVEWWNVTSTASGSNDDAKVKLFWRTHSQVSATNTDWANLRVVHFDGTDWNTEGNSPSISGSVPAWGSVESDVFVPNFSPITIGTRTANNPLPVELTYFTGTCLEDGISQISWTTASEFNSKQFVVERSEDGVHYTLVAVVPAAGFSNQVISYSITDTSVNANSSYYRLIEVDNNNQQTIYSFIQVKCNEVNGVHVYYTQPKVVVEVNSTKDKQVGFNVYEVSGKLVHQENKQVVRGYNRFDLSIKNKLADGIYIIQMLDGDKATSTKVMVH